MLSEKVVNVTEELLNPAADIQSEAGGLLSLSGDYDIEVCELLVDNVAKGVSEQIAARYPEMLKNKVDAIDISPTKTQIAGKDDKLVVAAYGRQLMEGTGEMMKKCGEVVTCMVRCNYPIDDKLAKMRASNARIAAKIVEMTANTDSSVEKPDSVEYDKRASVEWINHDRLLMKEARATFDRLKNQEVTNNGGSPAKSGSSQKKLKKGGAGIDAAATVAPVEVNDAVEVLWEDSIDYAIYKRCSIESKENIKQKWDTKYLSEIDIFRDQVVLNKTGKKELDALQLLLKQESVKEQVLSAIQLAMTKIVSKIKAAVKDFSIIVAMLKGRVKLPNGRTVVDPYTAEDLGGIYQILYKEYCQPSLVMFSTMLFQLISMEITAEECQASPVTSVQKVELVLKTWNQLGVYKYMDQDKLFTICYLHSLPVGSDLRLKAITEVTEFLRKNEVNGELSVDVSGDMPIFTHLSDYVRRG